MFFSSISSFSIFAYNQSDANIINLSNAIDITKPTSLEQLRQMKVEDIVKLSKFDGRESSIVTAVKNQGSEGICWAFSLAAISETNILYKQNILNSSYNNINFNLSNRQIDKAVNIRNQNHDKLNFTNQDIINRQLGNGQPDIFAPAQILLQQNAPIISNNDAYEGETAAWLKDIVNVPNNVSAIKKAIAQYGAVAFAYRSRDIGAANKNYYTNSHDFDHASVIVGWDDSIDRLTFNNNLPKNNGSWIVKNSWGEQRHDKGYFYLSYESVIDSITALNYDSKSKYENLYYYDGLANLEEYAHNDRKNKIAVIFPAKKANKNLKEKLNAISYGIKGKNTTVKVSVYNNVIVDEKILLLLLMIQVQELKCMNKQVLFMKILVYVVVFIL